MLHRAMGSSAQRTTTRADNLGFSRTVLLRQPARAFCFRCYVTIRRPLCTKSAHTTSLASSGAKTFEHRFVSSKTGNKRTRFGPGGCVASFETVRLRHSNEAIKTFRVFWSDVLVCDVLRALFNTC